MGQVLLVDDEPGVLFALSELLESRGHRVVTASSGSEALSRLDGVDVVVVGPMDLTTSMGIPGQYGDARFHDALGEVADAARSAGKAAGILLLDPANLPLGRELGYTVVALGSEGGSVAAGLKQSLVTLCGG